MDKNKKNKKSEWRDLIKSLPTGSWGIAETQPRRQKESAVTTIGLLHFAYCLRGITDYPPKLSYMIDSGSTPRESSMPTTAFDIGPGPHM